MTEKELDECLEDMELVIKLHRAEGSLEALQRGLSTLCTLIAVTAGLYTLHEFREWTKRERG